MGRNLRHVLGTWIIVLTASGCVESSQDPAEQVLHQLDSTPAPSYAPELLGHGPHSALPAFVDGARRCGLELVPPGVIARPQQFRRLSQEPSLPDEQERRICSGDPA